MLLPDLSLFTVTEDASHRLASILKENGAAMLRIAVRGGGCSGFQYDFDLVPMGSIEETDRLISGSVPSGDWTIVVDAISAPYLEGSILDFRQSLTDSKFVFKNPNATAHCGCGQSFAA